MFIHSLHINNQYVFDLRKPIWLMHQSLQTLALVWSKCPEINRCVIQLIKLSQIENATQCIRAQAKFMITQLIFSTPFT